MLENLFLKLLDWAATPWGPLVLVIHSYLETFILPLPHDPVLMTVALANPKFSFVFGLISTAASSLGLATGYALGRWGGKTFLSKLKHNSHFQEIQSLIHRYHRWATFIACLTPIPDKLYCAIAGMMHLEFRSFILIGTLARAVRFLTVAGLIFFFGEPIREWILHSMKAFLIVCLFGGIAVYLVTRFLHQTWIKYIEK